MDGPTPVTADGRRYVTTFAALLALGMALVAAFNWFVDPYATYGGPLIDGINTHKPLRHRYMRELHEANLRRERPRSVVLGSSRAGMGLASRHPGWPDGVAYNAALPSVHIADVVRMYRFAREQGARQVLVALDLLMFKWVPGQGEVPEKVNPVAGLVAWRTVEDSMKTLSRQRAAGTPEMRVRKAWTRAQSAARFAATGGQRKAFLKAEHGFMVKDGWFPPPIHQLAFGPPEAPLANVDLFVDMLRDAHANGVELILVINPTHARLGETMRAVGVWPWFEAWKRLLVERNETLASQYRGAPFALWDFADYNALTTEPVPPAGERERVMEWYIESSHYHKELGDLLLDRVLGHAEPGRDLPPDFGVRLTSANLETRLDAARAAGRRFREAYPEDAAEIAAIAADAAHHQRLPPPGAVGTR